VNLSIYRLVFFKAVHVTFGVFVIAVEDSDRPTVVLVTMSDNYVG